MKSLQIKDLQINNLNFNDVNIELCGMQSCPPDHRWGFGVRNCYLLHFVVDGKGVFINSYGNYHLTKGQGFIFYPGEKVFYKADHKEPWSYVWIGFSGKKIFEILKSCNLISKNPLYTFGEDFDILDIYTRAKNLETGRELYILSELYRFFFLNNKLDSKQPSKIDIAKNYIIQNFSSNITVSDVARFVGFERKYFSKIFTSELGISPSQYIQNIRMTNALKLLESTDLSVRDIAYSVGYVDLPTFTKAFKAFYDFTPTDIRKGKHPPFDGRQKY